MRNIVIKNILKIAGIAAFAAAFTAGAGTPAAAGTVYTGSASNYYLYNISRPLADGDCGNTSVIHEASFHFDFETNGTRATHMEERRVRPQYARLIRWGKPKVVTCDYCSSWADNAGLYSVQIFLEDDSGSEYIRKNGYELTGADLQSTGLDFEHLSSPLRVGIELTQAPGDYCPYCRRHIGDLITVDGLMWEMTCIDFSAQPQTVDAVYGGAAEFSVGLDTYRDVFGRSLDHYKWEMRTGGEWSEVNDGPDGSGTVFGGSDTDHLTIAGIGQNLYGSEFRCALTGANYTKAFSLPAGLSLAVYNPVPTLPPSVTTVPAITPGAGSDTSYTPSASSSAYVEPQGNPANSGSSSSSSSRSKDETDTYKGDITPSVSSTDQKITANGGSSAASSGKSSSGKSSSGKSSLSSSSSKTPGGSSSSGRRPGANYIMKNGVLYIVDDEDTAIGTDDGTYQDTIEESEIENAYSADDLAIEGNMYTAGQEISFWRTAPGYAVIAALMLALLLLALFFLFFGVIVCGEIEEHDEVFELCAIRLMRWHDGSWHVNLGCAFDDNAVLKLHIGLLFAVIFEDWDITGDVKGLYEGMTVSPAGRGMLMYRKNIRRNV